MKKCLSCGNDIAVSAKTCPSCGAKNKKAWYKKWWVWGIAAVIVIGASSNSGKEQKNTQPSGNNASSETAAAQPVKNTTPENNYSIGETVTTKDYEITVLSVNTVKKVGSQYVNSTPAEGATYVTLDVSYKNISEEPKGMFRFPSFHLIDGKGTKYSSDISASSYYATEKDPNRKVLSDLNPQIKVTDNKVFEVAEELYGDGEGWTISVDADKDFTVNIK
jgi:hypothetical protein